jgi:hypothetical protein
MACTLFHLGPVAARWLGGASGRSRIRMGKAIAVVSDTSTPMQPCFFMFSSRWAKWVADTFWKLAAAARTEDGVARRKTT